MTIPIRAGVATLIIAASLTGIVVGQTSANESARTGRISGRLVNEMGSPIQNQSIKFRNFTILHQATTIHDHNARTNRDGVFEISAQNRIHYEISLELPGTVFKELGTVEFADTATFDMGTVILRSSSAQGTTTVHVAGPVQVRKESSSGSSNSPALSAGVMAAYTLCSESAEFCAHSALHIVQRDGGTVDPPAEKEQVGVSSVAISPDTRAIGWLVGSDFCCASYPVHLLLVVYRPGKPLRRFRGDGRAIFGWHFVSGGEKVAFYQSYPHGDVMTHHELRDVETERLVDKWDEDSTKKIPQWVREFKQ